MNLRAGDKVTRNPRWPHGKLTVDTVYIIESVSSTSIILQGFGGGWEGNYFDLYLGKATSPDTDKEWTYELWCEGNPVNWLPINLPTTERISQYIVEFHRNQKEKETRTISVFGTGQEITENPGVRLHYIATAIVENYVWHVYERTN